MAAGKIVAKGIKEAVESGTDDGVKALRKALPVGKDARVLERKANNSIRNMEKLARTGTKEPMIAGSKIHNAYAVAPNTTFANRGDSQAKLFEKRKYFKDKYNNAFNAKTTELEKAREAYHDTSKFNIFKRREGANTIKQLEGELSSISKKQNFVKNSGKTSKTTGGFETRNTRRNQFSDAERQRRRTAASKEQMSNKLNSIFSKSNAQKAVGLGVGGYLVLNMFDKGGQMSNAELYGQQQQYGY